MVFALEHVNAQILALIRLNVRRLIFFDFFFFIFSFIHFFDMIWFIERREPMFRQRKMQKHFFYKKDRRKKITTTINYKLIKFEYEFHHLAYTMIPRKMKLHNAVLWFIFHVDFGFYFFYFSSLRRFVRLWSFNRLSLRFAFACILICVCMCVLGLVGIKFMYSFLCDTIFFSSTTTSTQRNTNEKRKENISKYRKYIHSHRQFNTKKSNFN